MLDGEMIIIKNKAFTIKGDGKVYPIGDKALCPIAVICFFSPIKDLKINTLSNFEEIKKTINEIVPTNNIFYAIKITGQFKKIELRSINKQNKNTNIEDVARNAKYFNHSNLQGTIVGFKSPPYIERIGVKGYHFHFIDKNYEYGGHVIDFELSEGNILIDIKHNMHLRLSNTNKFYKLNLEQHKHGLLDKIEKKVR
jgi:acetolactate decarboxylase